MNDLAPDKKLAVLSTLIEGNGIRGTERMTGVNRNTIMSLLARVENDCADFLDRRLRSLTCKRVQVDEIWTFVFVKEHRLNGVHNSTKIKTPAT